MFNGSIYVIGGFLNSNNNTREPSNRLFIYNPYMNNWIEGARMPTARGALTANFIEGILYVVGGAKSNPDNTQQALATNEAYYPANNTWRVEAPMPTARQHLASSVVDGKLYVIGGRLTDDASTTNLNLTESYDPIRNAWESALAPMPTARSDLAAVAINSSIFVIGGDAANKTFDNNERYDTKANRWTLESPMPTARHGLIAIAISDKDSLDNRIYAIGGGTKSDLSPSGLNQILHINRLNNFSFSEAGGATAVP
jgi:N-acetylneuraminic acid mutarotase